ncbi:hypothetical protein P5673_032124 [Acropora cervicornis]|uniref:Uncharacterized protein n=1 Tax=Acropora cervicornis TaxID=6130 RepID=A0AAD9PS11_ACRCE|nr:hypothetical protein P5673_032124 [Acropora cervicornis]
MATTRPITTFFQAVKSSEIENETVNGLETEDEAMEFENVELSDVDAKVLVEAPVSSGVIEELHKRDLKRKLTDQKPVEAKILKTELSIEKLEKHTICGTCPKSLQYSAKPNVAADILSEKELRDIKLVTPNRA